MMFKKVKNGNLLAVLLIITFTCFNLGCGQKNDKIINEINQPSIANHIILHSTYDTAIGTFSAGTAFILALKNDKDFYVLTALHIFGPKGGLNKQIESKDLNGFIHNIAYNDAFNNEKINITTKPITIPGAKVDGIHANTDLAVFKLLSKKGTPFFRLNTDLLKIGQHVWLATSLIDAKSKKQTLYEAVVTKSDNTDLRFKYFNPKILLTSTSGSPILNAKGEVVGLNLGGIRSTNELIGEANPAISIKKLIENAVKN